ncbi:hypothetical protein V8E53_009844 [Lactarius tabidus]
MAQWPCPSPPPPPRTLQHVSPHFSFSPRPPQSSFLFSHSPTYRLPLPVPPSFLGPGFWLLFQGHSATPLHIFPYAATKFLAYNGVRDVRPTALLCHSILQCCAVTNANAGARNKFHLVRYLAHLRLLHLSPRAVCVCMAVHTIHSSTPGCPERPSFLQIMRFICSEASLPSNPSRMTIPRDLFYTLPLHKFYHDFSVSLIGVVPYAGAGFLT